MCIDQWLRDVGVGVQSECLRFVSERETVNVINVVLDFLGRRWAGDGVAGVEIERGREHVVWEPHLEQTEGKHHEKMKQKQTKKKTSAWYK